MQERELCYSINEQDWIICDDAIAKNKEIEDIPVLFVMKYCDEYYIWCKNHSRFEKLIENESNIWYTESCVLQGIPVCFNYDDIEQMRWCHYSDYNKVKQVPIRWRLKGYDDKPVLLVGVDICEIIMWRSSEPLFGYSPRIRKYLYGNTSYNLATEDIYYFQKDISYPSKVTESAIDLLRGIAGRLYGLKPVVAKHMMEKKDSIRAFLFRPYDMNCYFVKGYLDTTKVPKDCKNAYHILCEQLEVAPPKGLKKLYHYNAYVVPMYRVLKELGFVDYNLFRPFFKGDKVGDLDFNKRDKWQFPFWNNDECNEQIIKKPKPPRQPQNNAMITQEEIDALLLAGLPDIYNTIRDFETWDKVKFLVGWVIREKGEKSAARRLLDYTKAGPLRWQTDISNMLYEHFDEISDEVKTEFLMKGFTRSVHDNLAYETNHLECVREEIYYLPFVDDWECEINGYKFEVPKYTDELADIGRELNNCVGSYVKKVLHRNCFIVAVRKDGGCQACIEIDGEGKQIIQALGQNNNSLSGEVLTAVVLWTYKMLLSDGTLELLTLDFHQENKEDNVYKNINDRISYFLYNIKELLSIPKEERGRGFYRALATKVVTREFYRRENLIGMPTLNEVGNDERAYINRVCPDLVPILEDAINGSIEAQMVMSELYKQFFPYNVVRSEYWYMKNRDYFYNFPSLSRAVYDEDEYE